MPSVNLKRLTGAQNTRIKEITLMGKRLREKPRCSLNKNIIQSRIDALERIWSEARGAHSEIEARDDSEADPYVMNNVYEQLQGLYEDTLDEFLTLLASFEVANERAVSSNSETHENSMEVEPHVAKLPKLDLPKFDGKYEDWDSFCDLFKSLVHNAPRISDATKLQYLKSCLTSSAADLVKDVSTTNANYLTTWAALKARFDNPRLIVNKHLSALARIPHLKKEDAVALRSFADEAQRIVRALANLKIPVQHWDIGLIFVLSERLDPESRKLWEAELSAKDRTITARASTSAAEVDPLSRFPKFNEFVDFLEKRAQTLSMISSSHKNDTKTSTNIKPVQGTRKTFHLQGNQKDNNIRCPLCAKTHALASCFKFKAKKPHDRLVEVRRLKLCFNCFGNHRSNDCTRQTRCNVCRAKHHTLLHLERFARPQNSGNTVDNANPIKQGAENVNAVTATIFSSRKAVLLATAQLTLVGPYQNRTRIRALLDQGSEASFITESVAQLLRLPKKPANITVTGLSASVSSTSKAIARVTLQSLRQASFALELDALILPRLTCHLPSRSILELDLDQFDQIPLADPQFYQRDVVDMIIGADIYGKLLRSGVKNITPSGLIAQNTALGWIVSGPVAGEAPRRADQTSLRTLHCVSEESLSDALQRFWLVEEPPEPASKLKPEEELCERQFADTHTRDQQGRYMVQLPVKGKIPHASGETRSMALGSLNHLYRRFSRDPKLADAYRDFMKAYESLGHMKRVPDSDINKPRAWYLPHHAVVTSTPMNWKIRVVFDASRRTRDQHCLNDFLLPGPALQRDLSLVLLNWRRYRFVFTADIVKMFRQIRVVPEDQDLQRIVWSPDPDKKPIEYKLTTVTYGSSCAPYLAIRTLLQLANDERQRFPLGAQCLEQNTYVDDTFSGDDELSVAIKKREELQGILNSAGIELDKWAANHKDLLPAQSRENGVKTSKSLDREETVKTLGVQWTPGHDQFTFNMLGCTMLAGAGTKRAILSNIARLYDPLGWLAPVTVAAKILMQDIWILKCEWDAPLPMTIRTQWLEYCNSLADLPRVSIDRWLGTSVGQSYELHGFSDASSRAYAAAVYLRVDTGDGTYRVSLLTAKTKVAPVKTISIPNLELCGAALLVKLLKHIRQLPFYENLPIYAWTDSEIVLNWLRKHPRSWKTFVANRVSYIQTELPSAKWKHVASKENPADLASRGSKASELINSKLWWQGPAWLALPTERWPPGKDKLQALHLREAPAEPELLTNYSSLTKLIRVLAYCRRPLLNLRRRRNGQTLLPSFLTASELFDARIAAIKMAQLNSFGSEISILKAKGELPKRHALRKLAPYVDKETGILRVGGRLAHSDLSPERKHPPILPHRSALSQLFVRYAHKICLHGGPTLTASTLMQFTWILGKTRLIKSEIRKCVTCQRAKPRFAHQLMGDLPPTRVTPTRPFSTTGLDYAGPIHIRTTKGRGHRSYKGYIALFVCFTTRAIHLEAVSDLTTASFLAAYRRFAGRRGICNRLYSDNATTFQGADKELRTMFSAASEFYTTAAGSLANDGTSWTFIPPNAPHYGGLWEAGVKSTKHHLKRVIGEHTLTFEELTTLLVQIEACLNSRPLCPLSADTDDLQALTPAHFLIGDSSGIIPEEEPPTGPENRLDRFQLLQRIQNNFWRRWSSEYIQQLQERGKWRDVTENFTTGQLVLIRDDRYPPSKWPLGRVIEVHPGPDGLVRVVTVKTATNTLRRHIARLCPLLTESESKN